MHTFRFAGARLGRQVIMVGLVWALLMTLAPMSDESVARGSSVAEVEMEIVGQLGGAVTAVAVKGEYAYVGVGPRVVVLSVSNRANPQWVGQTGLFSENVRAVAVSASLPYVYAAVGAAGLRIVRVDSPTTPVEVGAYTAPGNAVALAVDGAYVYILFEEGGAVRLEVVNVSNAQSPTGVGRYEPVPAVVISADMHVDVDVVGGYAYLALNAAGLQIVNVQSPQNPMLVGAHVTLGLARDVDVDGTYAYVATEPTQHPGLGGYVGGGLLLVDILDKAHPTEAGFCPIQDYSPNAEGMATHVWVQQPYAYVAALYGGLWVVDVSRADLPEKVKQYTDESLTADGLAMLDKYVYLVDPDNGLRVIDVRQPANPSPVGLFPAISWVENLDLAGNHVYLADGRNGLRVIDISNRASPTLRVSFKLPDWDWISDVKVSGRYAYATDSWLRTLRVIDVNNPPSPTQVRAVELPGIANAVAVQGNLALVASEGLYLVDIQVPTAAQGITACVTGGQPLGVAAARDYAYVAAGWGGLQVVSIANPLQPVRVGGTTSAYNARNVALSGTLAYVADGGFGLRIMDVVDARAPRQVAHRQYQTNGVVETVQQVALQGHYAYVAASGGIHAMNVSDPASAYEAGFVHLPWVATDIVVSDSYAYVMAGRSGMYILRIQITPPTPTPTRTMTLTPTATRTATLTPLPTHTRTATPTSVPTETPAQTATASATLVPSRTPSATSTPARRGVYLPLVRRNSP